MNNPIEQAAELMRAGGVIAYPTEAVYGLGCDPFHRDAVLRLLKIKNRSVDKGLILIASTWQQVEPLIQPIDASQLQLALSSWPGHTTWVFPASDQVPTWIHGKFNSVAIRISSHPVCHQLCAAQNGPVVSTSANYNSEPPIRDLAELQHKFSKLVDFIVPGELGNADKPSEIRDIKTDSVIRTR